MIRRTRVEVDLAAIVANAKAIRALTGTDIVAVVKADGYGHGAIAVAQALTRARVVQSFGVSLVEEGVALREAGVTMPILVMGPSSVAGEDELVHLDMTPVIASDEDLAALGSAARRANRRVEAHLKIDTGMGRLGVTEARAPELAIAAARNNLDIVGLMTHFACADSDDPADLDSMTRHQIARFDAVTALVAKAGAPIRVRHAANSSGALFFPDARYGAVRTGIAIYGNGRWPGGAEPQQAMRLVTEVAQIRTIEAGATVGYGAAWTAQRRTRLAILPVGYADGLPRRASGHAQAAIRSHRVPLVGRISMDIAMADVTDVPEIAVGDAAVLLGKAAGGVSIPTREYAAWADLSEYEVTCGMSKRVPRTYVGDPP